jgi:hypothetical protein
MVSAVRTWNLNQLQIKYLVIAVAFRYKRCLISTTVYNYVGRRILNILRLLFTGGIAQAVPYTATITDLCVPAWVPIILDSPTTALWKIPAKAPSGKAGETSPEISANFAYEVSLSYCRCILAFRKILHVTDGYASHPKEFVLRIFIALKNPSPSAGLEPAILETNSKLDSHGGRFSN